MAESFDAEQRQAEQVAALEAQLESASRAGAGEPNVTIPAAAAEEVEAVRAQAAAEVKAAEAAAEEARETLRSGRAEVREYVAALERAHAERVAEAEISVAEARHAADAASAQSMEATAQAVQLQAQLAAALVGDGGQADHTTTTDEDSRLATAQARCATLEAELREARDAVAEQFDLELRHADEMGELRSRLDAAHTEAAEAAEAAAAALADGDSSELQRTSEATAAAARCTAMLAEDPHALFTAAAAGDAATVERLLRHARCTVQDVTEDNGFTALHHAALNGHPATVRALLQVGR